MGLVKKSVNIEEKILSDLNFILENNPEMSFTTITNLALKAWIKNPVLNIAKPRVVSQAEIDQLIDENRPLLEDLSK